MQRPTPIIILVMFLLALIFWAGHPQAAELVIHTASYHQDRSSKWNEHNFGIGLKMPQDDGFSYQLGTYKNSYARRTVYLIAQQEWSMLDVQVGVFAGRVTGYQMPLAAGLMVSTNNLTFRFVPRVGAQTSGVIALELKKEL